jgi:predicted TIM-barrel fold metal-dependent hydrolase
MTERLPYRINDADNHCIEPPDVFERYIDPNHRDKVVRFVDKDGQRVQLFGDRPSKSTKVKRQVTVSDMPEMPGSGGTIPGSLLARLNPLQGLTDEERAEMIAYFRGQSSAYGDRDLRLALMDDQGIEAAIMFPAIAHDLELQFEKDYQAIYANERALNRWVEEEWGFAHRNRMFVPPIISLVDAQLAVEELERVLALGCPLIQIRPGPPDRQSLASPRLDGFWARVNEAEIGVAIHRGDSSYNMFYGRDWEEDSTATVDLDAFQWVFYDGDRPIMETVGAIIMQGLLGLYPKLRFCLSENGAVWLPYLVRKMDHAFLMGRKPTRGSFPGRPSQMFKQHFVVAPFPEENPDRVIEAVGLDAVVFGSDFPHGEGLPDPSDYLKTLRGKGEAEIRAIMRDNLARFLRLPSAA